MPRLTVDQVKAIAPDPASIKAGEGLADPRHWGSLGINAAAIWGECKGSAKEPYKVRIDLSNIGSDCTCPSHKFPCKHALGLLFLAANSPGKLKESNPPPWVSDWLEKRESKKNDAAAKKEKKKSTPEALEKEAAKRATKREKLAEAGIDALETWLKDIVHQGLAFAQNAPASFWENQTARMVDAQLPGMARIIRELAALPGSRSDWAQVMLVKLGRLFLLIQAYRKLNSLPKETQEDVKYILGWNVDQDELTTTSKGVMDDWLVLACQKEEDEKTGLRSQISWIWGKASRQAGLVLNYAYRAQPMDPSLAAGLTLQGELVYFPGAIPLRGVFKEKTLTESTFVPTGFPSLKDFYNEYAATLGKNPWMDTYPALLENVIPTQFEQNWFLRDQQNQAVPLAQKFPFPWELLALSGSRPLTVFGIWDGFAILPLATWEGERHIPFYA